MVHSTTARGRARYANLFLLVSITLLVLSVGMVIVAWTLPIKADVALEGTEIARDLGSWEAAEPQMEHLLVQIASRRLIKPSQVKAAVKDSGTAEQLLKKLKLRGVVKMGASRIAYISIEKQGTKKVQQGDKLLGFVIENITMGKVTLSLQGVEVILTH